MLELSPAILVSILLPNLQPYNMVYPRYDTLVCYFPSVGTGPCLVSDLVKVKLYYTEPRPQILRGPACEADRLLEPQRPQNIDEGAKASNNDGHSIIHAECAQNVSKEESTSGSY